MKAPALSAAISPPDLKPLITDSSSQKNDCSPLHLIPIELQYHERAKQGRFIKNPFYRVIVSEADIILQLYLYGCI